MTVSLIITGKASTISRQLAALQILGLVPSGPRIVDTVTAHGSRPSREMSGQTAFRTPAHKAAGTSLGSAEPAADFMGGGK